MSYRLKLRRAKNDSLYTTRWDESRTFLKLCADSLRMGDERVALNWLHEAHNLGRDHVGLHVATHLRYIRFATREGDYRRALGHLFWALSSPIMVPIARGKRTALIGEWSLAPRTTTIDQANVILLIDEVVDSSTGGAVDATLLLEAAPIPPEHLMPARTAPLSPSEVLPTAPLGAEVALGEIATAQGPGIRASK